MFYVLLFTLLVLGMLSLEMLYEWVVERRGSELGERVGSILVAALIIVLFLAVGSKLNFWSF